MTGKVYIKTQGCQMNEYDSDKMADVLGVAKDMEVTQNPEEADVLLLNTCSIREKAQEKVFSQLGKWNKLKEQNPNLVIGVGGCVASQEGEALKRRAPQVDVVFGPQTLHRLPDLIDQAREQGKSVVDISFPAIEKFDNLPPPKVDGPCAFVSIMEGCSKYCSYCVVPYTRGEEISRPLNDVLVEIMQLADKGVKEVTLLGQNVNGYYGKMDDGEICNFTLLLHYVATIDGIERIRYTTSHPLEFNDSLIEAYSEIPKLVNHLHLPVQSGSDRILAAMKRGYTALEYKSKVRKLRQYRPDISMSSDFIIGFPGETDQEFEQTMKLIEDVGFDYSFSFIFSARPGTPAASLEDSTPMQEKKDRLQKLQSRILEMANHISADMIGTKQTILINSRSKKSDLEIAGRTENNRVVNVHGSKDLIGQLVDVEITEALPNSLRGRLL
ncbi:MAG: tRNA (N6-isopentenyl adenosine(37)-C2)-methylthiotransferase MiaB [Gammaproteobacteria bacterium]|nr:tRNA (N6-isopentenyl adenosine(37)-C2)-methylthiotransferase MiaB [Gammaproteobacteria bacterium]